MGPLLMTPMKLKQKLLHTEQSKWWSLNSHKYPKLSSIARKLLCIPATFVPYERLFSSAGNILNKKTAALDPDNVDMLCFLHKNL